MGHMLSDRDRQAAEAAIVDAQTARAELRRRFRKTAMRNGAIRPYLRRLKTVMKPIRKELARTQFVGDSAYRFGLLNLSFRIQRERRRLWKMLY
jgi:hypothetical protein